MGALHPGARKKRQGVVSGLGELPDAPSEVLPPHGAFIEHYMQAKANIAIRHTGVRGYNHGFIIEMIPAAGVDCNFRASEVRKSNTSGHDRGFQQTAMFSGEVEVMQVTKQVIPSRIRPQVFHDDVFMDLTKPLYLFHGPALGVTKVGNILGDGKVSACRVLEAIACGQGAREQIKATADAVDNYPCFGVDNGGQWLDISEAVQLFSGLRIGIYSEGIGCVSHPRGEAFFQDWDLGYGPIDCSFSV